MHKSFHLLFSLAGAIFLFIFSVVSTPKHSFALSSATQQLSSNLFVNIAKKLNPAVVNVSTKSKIEKTHRNFVLLGVADQAPVRDVHLTLFVIFMTSFLANDLIKNPNAVWDQGL